ncbi:recombinase RecT [Mycobacteroides abscessus]|uniref:recombinase RecT n=1 Tax=Mycobacteroides abscessus TaxID=36809 RepID=UPI000C26C130|nr:recombinase RecT [Mycobacteroides abscessus]
MTETTTKIANEHATQIWPDPAAQTAGEVAVAQQPGALVPAEFGEFNLAVRRMLGLEDASEGEMQLFHHICQRSGLDPFAREVYMIGRDTEVSVWVDSPDTGNRRQEKRRVTKYTIQVSIHGIRRRAREIAAALGVSYKTDQPMWCGEDGQWREVWTDKKQPPFAAKFTVYRDGEPNTFVAHYDEFVQESGRGGDRGPNSMWSKMPRNQLRKCAEFNAIQMAFPDQLGGLVYDEAAQPTVIDGEVVEERHAPPQRAKGTQRLRERAAAAQAQSESAESEQPAAGETDGDRPMSEASRQKWLNRMFQLFAAGKTTEPEEQCIVIAVLTGADRLPEHRDDMTDAQLRDIVTTLNNWQKDSDDLLADSLGDILCAWDAKEPDSAEDITSDTDGEQGELGLESDQN